MFDSHVHSFFSADCHTPPEPLCEAAIRRGLDGIAITDHFDYDYPGYNASSQIDFDAYIARLDNLSSRYGSKLQVLKGVEVGIQPHAVDQALRVVRSYPFDYVLASVHIIGGVDPYAGTYYIGKAKREAYGRYLEEVLFMVRHFPDFDAVGHLDYITRYAGYPDRSMRYADHSDLFDSIFRELIAAGRGLEVNTGSYRQSSAAGSQIAFDVNILRRYKELGGEIVCLGSDSHGADYIGYRFDEFVELLKESGFRYVAHFEGRKPVFEAI
ncbi:MAG: histidinol-phosphatase HisJ family protein [Firmicutes bacterium]|nr:histidinol-phosphatase HisJ family protein [Candidatus Fermentithermobacillaceae bacterium]